MQARELLDRVSKDLANKPPQGQNASTGPAPIVVPTQPSVSITPPAASSTATMTAERELKARTLLNQAAGRSTYAPSPIIQAPPSTVVVAPQPAPVTTLPPP